MQIGGVGAQLPYPSKQFPNTGAQGQYLGLALQFASNEYVLPAGGVVKVPPGIWYIKPGNYSWIQWLDPVLGIYRPASTYSGEPRIVNSDGSNYRVFNPLGLPVGALVTNVGSGYSQSNTVVTASGSGGSTWRAIVGGAINTTVTIGADPGGTTGGTNWTLPPIVVFDAPPAGGVAATGYATVSAGAVSAITVVDQGAGYTNGAPGVSLYVNPMDPNAGIITIPACTTTITGSGQIAAVLCTYHGSVLTSAPTLTISGAGSSATATAIMALTVTAVTVSSGAANTPIWAAGGLVTTAAGAIANPSISTGLFAPRNMNAWETGASTGVIIDGGLYQVAPALSPSSATATMGSTYDVILMQAMPGT